MAEKSVGAIWVGKTKKGNEKLNLKLGEDFFLGFVNQFKTEDKHPDYRFIVFEEKTGEPVNRGAAWAFDDEEKGRCLSLIIDDERYVAEPVQEKSSDNYPDMMVFKQK